MEKMEKSIKVSLFWLLLLAPVVVMYWGFSTLFDAQMQLSTLRTYTDAAETQVIYLAIAMGGLLTSVMYAWASVFTRKLEEVSIRRMLACLIAPPIMCVGFSFVGSMFATAALKYDGGMIWAKALGVILVIFGFFTVVFLLHTLHEAISNKPVTSTQGEKQKRLPRFRSPGGKVFDLSQEAMNLLADHNMLPEAVRDEVTEEPLVMHPLPRQTRLTRD